MICFACKKKVILGELLRCVGCKTCYHYACLNVTSAVFTEQYAHLKSTFKCEACSNITQRVRVTDDTPVRGVRAAADCPDKDANHPCEEVGMSTSASLNLDSLPNIMEMVKGVITERLNSLERNLMEEIKITVTALAVENSKLRQELSVANSKCVSYEKEINTLKVMEKKTRQINEGKLGTKGTSHRQNTEATPASVAEASSEVIALSDNSNSKPMPQPNVSYASVASNSGVSSGGSMNMENNWIEVKGRKKLNPIIRGGNRSIVALKAVERKKYLHVWRLEKTTTEVDLKEYVQKILGEDSELVLTKIQPKTERDYASFKIGVTESNFEKLCVPEVWPMNVEVSEWTFFRRPATPVTLQPQA